MADTGGAVSDAEEVPVQHVVAMLRERLYGAISCLATLAVLTRYTGDDTDAWARVLDVAVTMGGLWAASLLADWVAHLSVHGHSPHGIERLRILQASGQILQASVFPLLVLGAAGIGLLDTDDAMWVAKWILVVELGLIALAAVRRTRLPVWQQIVTVVSLAGLGLLVIAIKVLAH
ncbi:hypothetical protein CRI77_00010 [Mycolicibacterium duvalii]|uniref:Uncharacterized protein n=1 Tax=Mycolicibacterium duvalii TaxID=39688 RepID=A0A7I7K723_9MYCO|nr:hypothetical protein [Mycolicibacterium duvalii]MCV7368786.1 hypothetical protein [Mycolicibacterium duvalii]PEG44295.1 hypothetical protein CRI77_00010 [Mycolicibacterium duvalii]BBX19319.1 hypothetical protein MDUV_41790 [Mycolicibacterium duvalii]